ncbi:MAG: hypothetical protein ACJAS1_003443 [Oleiphilaceae bacterium]|jgi:hypothetical protein
MSDIARLYNCHYCHCQVIICCRCDRGNRYCKRCSPLMRLNSRHRASKRYQNTAQGQLKHANRQKRYRERLKQKVTHKGSNVVFLHNTLNNKRKNQSIKLKPKDPGCSVEIFCHCCHRICSPFVRSDTLERTKLRGSFRKGKYEQIC